MRRSCWPRFIERHADDDTECMAETAHLAYVTGQCSSGELRDNFLGGEAAVRPNECKPIHIAYRPAKVQMARFRVVGAEGGASCRNLTCKGDEG